MSRPHSPLLHVGASASAVSPALPLASAQRSPFIVGPAYDLAFFLLPPVVSLLLGIAISGSDFSHRPLEVRGQETTAAALILGSIIHAHLVAVFFRSHGNPGIRRRFPWRFTLVPVVVYAAIVQWEVVAIGATVLATFWDVWHSGAQTFGLGRIYERNAGNPPAAGRGWDYWLNQLLYAGPILAGATMLDHVDSFASFDEVGLTWLGNVPARMGETQHAWAQGILVGGIVFLGAYLLAQWRLFARGHAVAWPRVFLYVTTGACSVYTWGFNSFGEAFFIMNLLHAVQYLALVWCTEGSRLSERLVRVGGRFARPLALATFLACTAAYGIWAELLDPSWEGLWALTIVVSLMHFWYDGFIWSVARREV